MQINAVFTSFVGEKTTNVWAWNMSMFFAEKESVMGLPLPTSFFFNNWKVCFPSIITRAKSSLSTSQSGPKVFLENDDGFFQKRNGWSVTLQSF